MFFGFLGNRGSWGLGGSDCLLGSSGRFGGLGLSFGLLVGNFSRGFFFVLFGLRSRPLFSPFDEELFVFLLSSVGFDGPLSLFGQLDFFSSESFGSDQSLDFSAFDSFLSTSTFEGPSNNRLFNENLVVFLLQSEQFFNFVSSLGSQLPRKVSVGNSVDLLFSLLHDLQSKHSHVRSHNAPTNRFSLFETASSFSETRMTSR